MISDIQQFMGETFIFGHELTAPHKPPVAWNPDSDQCMNPSLLMVGTSGSGKTTLIKQLVRYLQHNKKHVILFDLQGDLQISGENYIEVSAWNSEVGINPFEFDLGLEEEDLRLIIDGNLALESRQQSIIQSAGPKIQIEDLICDIKSTVMSNMGDTQIGVLKFLFEDTYKMAKIGLYDYRTWLNPLPTLEDTLALMTAIVNRYNDVDNGLDSEMARFARRLSGHIISAQDEINNVGIDSYSLEQSTAYLNAEQDLKSLFKRKVYSQDIDQDDFFLKYDIDYQRYMQTDVIRTIKKLMFYIQTMIESSVFHAKKPHLKGGLNRIDISGLRLDIQRIFVRIFSAKLFRACKMQGPYLERPKDKRNRGSKVNTYIVIDEARLVVPKGKERQDPSNASTRIALEGRKYGIGQILAAQSSAHYPEEFLKVFDMQVVLTVNKADYDTTRKNFGIAKEQLDLIRDFGLCLVKTRTDFKAVTLPWYQSKK